jgi:two-component system, NtrC family, sensor histidine kinase HydH
MSGGRERWGAATWVATAWLVAACLGFAAWQYREFTHERQQARRVLSSQLESLGVSLAAGIRSHRRMGRFFEEQIQDVIDQLCEAPSVLAAVIENIDGEALAAGGAPELLVPERNAEVWQPAGLQTSFPLEVRIEPGGGAGRGPGWMRDGGAQSDEAELRQFQVTLLADRRAADNAVARAARLRATVALAGIVGVSGLALAWQNRTRSIEASAQAALLQAESQRLRELSQAAAGLAHETRNPLGVIRGNLQALEQSESRGSDPSLIRTLIEECDRVTARINQFLAFARPKAPSLQRVEFAAVANQLALLLEPDLESRNLRIALDNGLRGSWVQADPDLLRQIVFNLLLNAIAFAPEGSEIVVRATPQGAGKVKIAICDRGPGVAEGDRVGLFTPYFTTRSEGSGLGLAIVKRLAEAQGWRASYVSGPELGACFEIEGIDEAT